MRSIRTVMFGLALVFAGAVAGTFLPPSVVQAQAKEKVFVNLTSSERQRVTMALNFSTRLLQGGNTVTLFLNVDGVQVGSTKFPALSEQRTALGAFMKAGGTVVVCQHCMTVRNVLAADLMPGLTVGGEGGAMQAFLASTRSISY